MDGESDGVGKKDGVKSGDARLTVVAAADNTLAKSDM